MQGVIGRSRRTSDEGSCNHEEHRVHGDEEDLQQDRVANAQVWVDAAVHVTVTSTMLRSERLTDTRQCALDSIITATTVRCWELNLLLHLQFKPPEELCSRRKLYDRHDVTINLQMKDFSKDLVQVVMVASRQNSCGASNHFAVGSDVFKGPCSFVFGVVLHFLSEAFFIAI